MQKDDSPGRIWHADLPLNSVLPETSAKTMTDHQSKPQGTQPVVPVAAETQTTPAPLSEASATTAPNEHEAVAKPAAKKTASRSVSKRRSFKGLSLEQRQNERREKLIEAGLQVYGTQGFFSVTVRDVCNEAKLTERYFYESFKRSEELFKTIYLRLIEQLQQNILAAVMQSKAEAKLMIEAGLTAMFKSLQDDPRMARILFIDAILVHEMHGNTINEAVSRFDRMIQAFMMLMFPKKPVPKTDLSLLSTGLNGFVTHIAMRWVIGGFREPLSQVLAACQVAYLSILQWMEKEPQD
jgi:AcrR family transcriptional regulator